MASALNDGAGFRPRLSAVEPRMFPGVDTFTGLPLVIASGGRAHAVGKGRTLRQRRNSALGEWAERSILYAATPERRASVRQLGGSCLSPTLFGLDLVDERPDLVVPYSPMREVGWRIVHSLSGETRWMHQPEWNGEGFFRATSNGAAVGCSRKAALSSAIAELQERHAFVAWWYGLGAVRPFSPEDADWRALCTWFEERDWSVAAHLLPSSTTLPVVMASAFQRDGSGRPRAAIIGVGTGAGARRPLDGAAVAALLEVLQALETFSMLQTAGRQIEGDLAHFFSPSGAVTIEERLRSAAGAPVRQEESWTACPIEAAHQSGTDIWATAPGTGNTVAARMNFVQVFSPHTLPYPSTGRGRRLNHPVLLEALARHGRDLASIPPLPHPLG